MDAVVQASRKANEKEIAWSAYNAIKLLQDRAQLDQFQRAADRASRQATADRASARAIADRAASAVQNMVIKIEDDWI